MSIRLQPLEEVLYKFSIFFCFLLRCSAELPRAREAQNSFGVSIYVYSFCVSFPRLCCLTKLMFMLDYHRRLALLRCLFEACAQPLYQKSQFGNNQIDRFWQIQEIAIKNFHSLMLNKKNNNEWFERRSKCLKCLSRKSCLLFIYNLTANPNLTLI